MVGHANLSYPTYAEYASNSLNLIMMLNIKEMLMRVTEWEDFLS